jgi:hypothetical protein
MSIHQLTFIIDCPWCKAKVAAIQHGRAHKSGQDEELGEPYAMTLVVGECPNCQALLAGEKHQVMFEGWDGPEDQWTDVVRIFPRPPKTFSSYRIPRVVRDSISEADKSLQVNANIAACVMLGRALEAVCRDVLESSSSTTTATAGKKKHLMLGQGIKKLKDKGVIDDRLYDWSQQLHAFRNLAAHPEDVSISREDAEDLQTFVYAIIEYIYDLTDRYNDFKERLAKKEKTKKESGSRGFFSPSLHPTSGSA